MLHFIDNVSLADLNFMKNKLKGTVNNLILAKIYFSMISILDLRKINLVIINLLPLELSRKQK